MPPTESVGGAAPALGRAAIAITPLAPADRARWEDLARGYKTFYETELPPSRYEATWQRLLRGDGIYGVGAHLDGALVGIAHYLFHAHVWMDDICYLQDLFVDERARGRGVARALIERVAEAARQRGAPRFYWQTRQDNARARALYDTLARFNGFIRYDYPVE
ncbi:MAG: GNAT family N-acetyltransferase [Proteobacteria bacterium]|nr:GNAT family N-acetyltransferase [Pseudomonadota bacterium]MBI3499728.1 GNAT family N-acetyltransferase [Pseudomonadota bacterium]